MRSVNTNYSAMIALQNLNLTQSELETVQNRINTGFKVSSARDNGAIFAIAEGQRSRVASLRRCATASIGRRRRSMSASRPARRSARSSTR
jgi:flagellin-like hook-associated protein FlgL